MRRTLAYVVLLCWFTGACSDEQINPIRHFAGAPGQFHTDAAVDNSYIFTFYRPSAKEVPFVLAYKVFTEDKLIHICGMIAAQPGTDDPRRYIHLSLSYDKETAPGIHSRMDLLLHPNASFIQRIETFDPQKPPETLLGKPSNCWIFEDSLTGGRPLDVAVNYNPPQPIGAKNVAEFTAVTAVNFVAFASVYALLHATAQ